MTLLSPTVSLTRYHVEGEIASPIIDTVHHGLVANVIMDIDDDTAEKSVGWTSFRDSFKPDFEGSSFVVDPYFVFSFRIDRKSVPAKVVRKKCAHEAAQRMKETGRDYLSRSEKQAIKEKVIQSLCLRIPATPDTYDVLWHPEARKVWFFTTRKAVCESFETLFAKSFSARLIRIFPYTLAALLGGLNQEQQDRLDKLSPVAWTR